ncbi:hypothetical protein Q3G72_033883 [Acer saccharum]|nr:hypothetical protein Q3G72_033883 [Acer saccharum]
MDVVGKEDPPSWESLALSPLLFCFRPIVAHASKGCDCSNYALVLTRRSSRRLYGAFSNSGWPEALELAGHVVFTIGACWRNSASVCHAATVRHFFLSFLIST